jgi:hypothetical protein
MEAVLPAVGVFAAVFVVYGIVLGATWLIADWQRYRSAFPQVVEAKNQESTARQEAERQLALMTAERDALKEKLAKVRELVEEDDGH